MKRIVTIGIAVCCAAALVALLAYGLAAREADTRIEQAVVRGEYPVAPSRELPLLGQNGTQSIADLRGKVVVLNFWASWCGPCKTEAPVLDRAQARLEKAGAGTVLGVTYDDSTADSLDFVRQFGLRYPSVRDVGTTFAASYGTFRVPETFVIDRQGRIVDLYRGQIDEAFIDHALEKALAR